MPASSKFLAWIEPSDGSEFQAAFVAAMASRRKPATHRCASPDEARRWVEVQAAELGVPVEWVDQPSFARDLCRRQPCCGERQRIVLNDQPTLRRRIHTGRPEVGHLPVTDLRCLREFVQGQRPAVSSVRPTRALPPCRVPTW
jgi:hypothetical protein